MHYDGRNANIIEVMTRYNKLKYAKKIGENQEGRKNASWYI